MALSRPNVKNAVFDRYWIEKVILKLGDKYHIRVQWDRTTAISTGTLAVVGALVGVYARGKLWHAAVGAAVGGATGFALASHREIWSMIREKIEELIYIVYNYLRRIDPVNYIRAVDIIVTGLQSDIWSKTPVSTKGIYLPHEHKYGLPNTPKCPSRKPSWS